jgi:hypothetical protein
MRIEWFTLGKSDYHEPPANESEADLPGFAIVFPAICSYQNEAAKHLMDIWKVDAVLGNVRFSFRFIPFEPHVGSVHTERMYVKRISWVVAKDSLRIRTGITTSVLRRWRVPNFSGHQFKIHLQASARSLA